MSKNIEIYVRPQEYLSKTLLHLHIPKELIEEFITVLRSGEEFEPRDVPINLEMDIFPNHVTDEDERNKIADIADAIHIRMPISKICIIESE